MASAAAAHTLIYIKRNTRMYSFLPFRAERSGELQTHAKPDFGTGFDLLLLKGDLCMCAAIKAVRSFFRWLLLGSVGRSALV
jgi:hypothetical protein